MALGERIRTRRKEMKLSLRELGQRAHLTASFLCDLEHDKRRIGADNLFALSQVLGLPMDQLMGQDGAEVKEGIAIQLPGSLVTFASNRNVPFRHATCIYWLMRTIMDHRIPSRRMSLDSVDWVRFYEAIKEWLK